MALRSLHSPAPNIPSKHEIAATMRRGSIPVMVDAYDMGDSQGSIYMLKVGRCDYLNLS